MKRGAEPAYPVEVWENTPTGHRQKWVRQGMSIRLKIAADAMCAMIVSNQYTGIATPLLCECALNFADELLKQEEGSR